MRFIELFSLYFESLCRSGVMFVFLNAKVDEFTQVCIVFTQSNTKGLTILDLQCSFAPVSQGLFVRLGLSFK